MKINTIKFFYFVLFAFTCNFVFAEPRLVASNQYIDFAPNDKFNYLNLQNQGDEKVFVEIDVKRIGKIGTGESKLRDATRKEIVVVPKKIILKPGQSRKIKVMKKIKPSKKDYFFRIYTSTSPLPSKNPELEDKKAIGLKLHVGIGTNTLVIVRPKTMEPKLNMAKMGSSLVVENVGNTTVQLQSIRQCDGDDCINYSNNIVFPMTKRTIKLQYSSRPIILTQNVAGNEREHRIS